MARQTRKRRQLIGTVVSDKMQKTVIVQVARRVPHGTYGKFVTHRKKYKAHDETGEFHVGDRVEISECRPLSREKRWRVTRLVERVRAVDLEETPV
jgi:small subunit ribosomal protein S17